MTRRSRMKQEIVDINSNLPTSSSSEVPSRQPDICTTEMPLRAGSQQPIGPAGSSFMVQNAMIPYASHGRDQDIEMTDTPRREAMQVMGDQSRQLIQVIQKLEALKIRSTLPSLPMFVVIGDQSAGKSSIIEAACDLKLPRNEGTCTRCPFQITTTASRNGEPWQCKITLHKNYTFTPNKHADRNSTFDHWVEQELSINDFVTVYSKADLDLALRRAQLAILNPQKDHRLFVDVDLDRQTHRVGFSPNIIKLEITAPSLPELSFYDLPGAINTLADESQQYLVRFVESLLKQYISNEKAYVLLACAASNDIDNSTAFKFLRECAASSRSLGVYTKPDTIEVNTARLSKLRNLLLGKEYRLGDGWFVTRQLSQKEIDREQISHADARDIEAEFFAGEPWSTDLVDHANRFGIPNLSSAISKKLTQHILNELPEIVKRVVERLNAVEEQLSLFPEPAVAPFVTVSNEIAKVAMAMRAEIDADSSTSTFRAGYREVFRGLFKKLKALKPEVIVSTPGYEKPSISVSSDEESPSSSKARRLNGGGGRVMSATPNQSAQKRARRTPGKSSASDAAHGGTTKHIFRLDRTQEAFDAAPGADIPGQTSEAVTKRLVKETLGSWGDHPVATVGQVTDSFRTMLQTTANSTLAKYAKTEFLRCVKDVSFALLDELSAAVGAVVIDMVAAELHRPITYNTPLLTKTRLAHESTLLEHRNLARMEEYYDVLEAEGRKVPAKPEQKKKAMDANFVRSELGEDEYDREIKALAWPLAYYDIASAQLVDSIAKQVEYGLMDKFETRLYTTLLEDLHVGNQEQCAWLLAEDPETERQRAALVVEKEKLGKALAELNGLPNIHA